MEIFLAAGGSDMPHDELANLVPLAYGCAIWIRIRSPRIFLRTNTSGA